jgi:drug/metabolite transporter (DMT)-like permease
VVAGLCFGAFFALFGSVGQSSGLWPVVLDRVVSVVMVGAALVWLRTPAPAAWRPGIGLLLACGIFDVSAHSLYVFAGQDGLTSEVAVLSALYPATTVVLAVIVLRERLRPIHVIGLALAGIGVSLIALS